MSSVLRNFLYILIIFCFIFEIVRFYEFVKDFSNWQYVDWLINYQGGFVRRGFIGEILYIFHKLLKIDLDILIFIFVLLLYFFISYFLIQSIKYLENYTENLLIFLSPGFFIYPVMNSGIIGRKEILLIFCIIFFVFFEKKISNRYLLPSFLIALIILCFSHSGFLFYSQFLFFLFTLIKHNRNLSINKTELFLFCLIVFLIAIIINSIGGDQTTIDNICLSIKKYVSENCGNGDQIYHLSDVNTGINFRLFEKLNLGSEYLLNYFIIYGLSIFIVFFFISKRLINSKFDITFLKYHFKKPYLLFLIIFLLTFPMFVLGRDWGRYIYISYSCIYFIYIYCLKEKILIFNNSETNIFKKKFILIIFIFFYTFFFTFPFYDARSFKITLLKPIVKILNIIN